MIVGVAIKGLPVHMQPMVTPGHTNAGAQIHESFLRETMFFTNSQKFSPSKVSRYTVGILCMGLYHCLYIEHNWLRDYDNICLW